PCFQFQHLFFRSTSYICFVRLGVDETVVVMLRFSRNRMAVHWFDISSLHMHQVLSSMWSPTSLVVNGKETHYPVPEPYLPLNFPNGTGMRYEAQEVRQCLLKGMRQPPFFVEDVILCKIYYFRPGDLDCSCMEKY
ncbi:hypothetical protein XENOCAPTIV_021273, partial [Xenoophorus captivus]